MRDLKGIGWNEPLQKHLPGAMNVALLFSAANINTVKTSSAVKNISMKTPWAMDVPLVRVVVNAGVPGNMHRTRAAACTFQSQHDFLRGQNLVARYSQTHKCAFSLKERTRHSPPSRQASELGKEAHREALGESQ